MSLLAQLQILFLFFFFNDTATTEIYTLSLHDALPIYLKFETDTIEKMEAFQFDDPWDERRYFNAGDDQLNGVGDAYVPNLAAFVDRLRQAHPDFPTFGGV